MTLRRVLVTGAAGQIGSELTGHLVNRYGSPQVVVSDCRQNVDDALRVASAYEIIDVTNKTQLESCVKKYEINTIIHLAAILSATGENNPELAWQVNMNGTYNVLEVARQHQCSVFVPSSIAAFGPGTPRDQTPQDTLQRPTSMYGVTKVAGELLMDYYYKRFGLDTRGVRYPGLISYVAAPGGGTTDYAVDIFYAALREGRFSCFLQPDARLPMMYMPDALRAVTELLEADPTTLTHRNAFNISAFSFTPAELAAAIRKHIPNFEIEYHVDPMRQAIADSWPASMDDSVARADWGWQPEYSIDAMVSDMLDRLSVKLGLA